MQYMCDNENEDVLRVLAFDNTVKDLILEIGASTSSIAKLRNKGFHLKEIQELLEIGAINIENDHWLLYFPGEHTNAGGPLKPNFFTCAIVDE